MKELFTAFIKAQSEMEHAKKGTKNEFFKNMYATLPEVIDIILPCLNSNGLALIQSPTMEQGQVILTQKLIHVSGESMDLPPTMATPRDAGPQSVGSTITYLRRYSMMSIFGIGAVDDDGNAGQGNDTKTAVMTPLQDNKTAVLNDNGLSLWSNRLQMAKTADELVTVSAKIQGDGTLTTSQLDTLRNVYKARLEQLKGVK